MPQLVVRIPEDMAAWLEQKCPARGDASKLVRQLLTAEQMKEAAAPLVPESPKRVWKGTAAEWAAFEEGAGFETPQDEFVKNFPRTQMPTLNEFDAHKAKPKARRKKGSVGNPSVDLRDALQATVEATRKPKTCQHSNIIRKLGQPFCQDCGEFV